mmetsp:Transcript_125869/g.218161  ORF Transcript_125869/g.218161 Transcript_125869/m.218161 type:complete len:219 (+) Transcript_125869:653-1309(+)
MPGDLYQARYLLCRLSPPLTGSFAPLILQLCLLFAHMLDFHLTLALLGLGIGLPARIWGLQGMTKHRWALNWPAMVALFRCHGSLHFQKQSCTHTNCGNRQSTSWRPIIINVIGCRCKYLVDLMLPHLLNCNPTLQQPVVCVTYQVGLAVAAACQPALGHGLDPDVAVTGLCHPWLAIWPFMPVGFSEGTLFLAVLFYAMICNCHSVLDHSPGVPQRD